MFAPKKLWSSLIRRFFGTPAVPIAPTEPRRAAVTPSSFVAAPEEPKQAPSIAPRAFHLDGVSVTALSDWENSLLVDIGKRIESGRYQVPQIPATSLAAMNLVSNPAVEIRKLSELIRKDPVLSTDVLRTANSVSYASRSPAETLDDAIMRMGLRGLRSIFLSISVRTSILTGKGVDAFAEEVWRQANSMATIARAISRLLGFDPERAYLLGLLQDMGKIPLLALLRERVPGDHALNVSIVGLAFREHHEQAGLGMARTWKLSDEIVSVAGCHHEFEKNADFPRSSALASLVRKVDLYLGMGAEHEFLALSRSREFDVLDVPEERRREIIGLARGTFQAMSEQPSIQAA